MEATIDLTRYCLAGSTRYGKPIQRAGFKYATNGSIVVKVPSNDPDDSEFGDWTKTMFNLFEKGQVDPINAELWPEQTEKPETCSKCNGIGTVEEIDCSQCDGTGTYECFECGHDGDCSECDGSGVEQEAGTCPDCEGRKVIYPHRQIAGLKINEKYDAMVRELPHPRIVGRCLQGKALRVEFDGGELVLMGMLPDRAA